MNAAGASVADSFTPASAGARNGTAGHRPPPWITASAVVVAAAALLPLAFVIGVTLNTPWSTIVELIVRPRVGELLVNTVLLIALTVPLCVVLSVALAWLTERSNLPG